MRYAGVLGFGIVTALMMVAHVSADRAGNTPPRSDADRFSDWLRRDREAARRWQGGQDRAPAVTRAVRDDAPSSVFLTEPPVWCRLGHSYRYHPKTSWPGDAVAFSLDQAPEGMVIDATTGILEWTPAATDTGPTPVTLLAIHEGSTNAQAFTITVAEPVELQRQEVGTNGATVAAGACRVVIPPLSVDDGTVVSLSRLSASPPPDAAGGISFVGDLLSVSVSSTTRSGQPVTPSVPFEMGVDMAPGALPEGTDIEQVQVYMLTGNARVPVIPVETRTVRTRNTTTKWFSLPRVADVGLGYPSRFTLYSHVLTRDRVAFYYRSSLLDATGQAKATAYCEQVLASLQLARADLLRLGFRDPGDLEVRIEYLNSEFGYCDSISRIIYLVPDLAGENLQTTPAHEFFHASQGKYYWMTLHPFTGIYWWAEATAVWFSSIRYPKVIVQRIGLVPGGYLRAPLADTRQAAAYSKGSFVAYAVGQRSDVVKVVTEGSTGLPGVMDTLNRAIDLQKHYPLYVDWAIRKYGPGDSSCGRIFIADNLDAVCWQNYSPDGQATGKPSGTPYAPVPLEQEDRVMQARFQHRQGSAPYYACIYEIIAENGARNKAVDLAFESTGPAGGQTFLLKHDRKARAYVEPAEPIPVGPSYRRIRGLGDGPTDKYDKLSIAYVETQGALHAQNLYTWTIEARDDDPFAGPWVPPAAGANARLKSLTLDGQRFTDYAGFEPWMKAWIRENVKPLTDTNAEGGSQGGGGLSVSNVVGGVVTATLAAVSSEVTLMVIPAVKMGFDGISIPIALHLVEPGKYSCFIPGMSAEEVAAAGAAMLQHGLLLEPVQGETHALEAVIDKSFGEGQGLKGRLRLEVAEDLSRTDLALSLEWTGPASGEGGGVRSLKLELEMEGAYAQPPRGKRPVDMEMMAPFMQSVTERFKAVKAGTDAVFRPIMENALGLTEPPAAP